MKTKNSLQTFAQNKSVKRLNSTQAKKVNGGGGIDDVAGFIVIEDDVMWVSSGSNVIGDNVAGF